MGRYISFLMLLIVLTGCTRVVYDTNGDVTRSEFMNKYGWGLPLPESASQIRAKSLSEGTQQNQLYLRFKCDLSEFQTTLARWQESPAFSNQSKSMIRRLPVEQNNYVRITKNLEWWRPWDINSGYFTDLRGFSGPVVRIWVDENASIVYIFDES